MHETFRLAVSDNGSPQEVGKGCSFGSILVMGHTYMIRRLSDALFLTAGNLAVSIVVKYKATIDAHGYVYIHFFNHVKVKRRTYIRAWASALLVQPRWAMLEPPAVGRVTIRTPTPFLYNIVDNLSIDNEKPIV